MDDRSPAGDQRAGGAEADVPWRAWTALGLGLAARPTLWWEALRQGRLLLRPGGRAWLRFRLTTAYGTARPQPVAADVVAWLKWARRVRRAS